MRTDILEYLQNEIYLRCKESTNKFGMGCYYHIESVVKNGEILAEKYNAEELCVADADAISHFDSVPSLLYLAYVERQMSIEEGIRFVKEKLERSFCKLSNESKEFYVDKYHQVMSILG